MRFKDVNNKKRKWLVRIITAELVLVVVCLCGIFVTSYNHIIDVRTAAISTELENFNVKPLTSKLDKCVSKAKEQVAVVLDEQVWTTEQVNYRTGPGTQYETVGTLGIYSGVQRTGTTYNDWSQVEINDNTYYVTSEYLTTEVPLITATGAKGEYQKYALSQLPNYGWDETEIIPLINLWNRESGWNPNAHNGGSGAHGIPQALPASKMASEGSDYYTNGNTQIRWGLNYIKGRYGSPSNAWAHFQSHHWY